MTSPRIATPRRVDRAQRQPELKHACVRCGAPVAIDVGLCERCNPLGLRDLGSSQMHGIAIGGVVLFVVIMAVVARFALAGVGPFEGTVAGAVPDGGGLAITLSVTNSGSSAGQTTCRVTDPRRPDRQHGRVHAEPADRAGPDPRRSPDESPRWARPFARSWPSAAPRDGRPRPRPEAVELADGVRDELAFALDLAARAGVVLMDHYERLEQIDYKSARDVVTEADHLSEALILDAIRAAFPADAILAEETGEHQAKAGEAPTSGRGRVWIVDPLDGTVNYANGIPVFCVSIGLVVDGRPAVGVILDPTRDEMFAATVDGPATLDGRPVRASDKDKLSDFVISMSLNGRAAPRRARNVRKAIRISRSMGSAALALAYVANGRFDAFVQQGGLSAWDVAAAGLIAERGGATVTSMDGGPWFDVATRPKSIGILAAPPAHHATLLGLAR